MADLVDDGVELVLSLGAMIVEQLGLELSLDARLHAIDEAEIAQLDSGAYLLGRAARTDLLDLLGLLLAELGGELARYGVAVRVVAHRLAHVVALARLEPLVHAHRLGADQGALAQYRLGASELPRHVVCLLIVHHVALVVVFVAALVGRLLSQTRPMLATALLHQRLVHAERNRRPFACLLRLLWLFW